MTKIIGLTGGIGSGKTTIANYFSQYGIPIYIADNEARLISSRPEIIAEIEKNFGHSIFTNGILNREKLAKIVFTSPEKLAQLNAIIHPAVYVHFQNWMPQHKKKPYIIYETAILFENGNYKNCDKIITVTATIELRILRVMKRDSVQREQVLERINSQWTDEQRASKSDFVIDNNTIETAKNDFDKILKILNIFQ